LLKAKVDQLQREGWRVHVVASGSSALLVGAGANETMAGRFERLVLRHWPPAQLASAFGLPLDEAVRGAVTLGTYPGAVPLRGDPPRWRSYIQESIIEPAVGRDILMLQAVRRPALLRQVFALCAGHPAEILSLQKLAGLLMERGALETVAHYLHVLEQGFLVAPLQKFSDLALRRRNAPPKLVVLNQAILSALHPGEVPGPDTDPERWGRWVENACLAHAWNSGQAVTYWRAQPLEVDAVIAGSWG
jgi:predicted AAA+ superfamily ATPase